MSGALKAELGEVCGAREDLATWHPLQTGMSKPVKRL